MQMIKETFFTGLTVFLNKNSEFMKYHKYVMYNNKQQNSKTSISAIQYENIYRTQIAKSPDKNIGITLLNNMILGNK